jgi:hypothetical protein
MHDRASIIADSRRYHRGPRPPGPRFWNYSSAQSHPEIVNPFGHLPFKIAAGENTGFSRPLQQGFAPRGGGPGTPTQNFISQATPVLSSVIPSYTALGQNITAGSQNAYNAYQGQIDAFLQQLPGFQASAGAATAGGQQALDYAGTAAKEAFSPLEGRALFQEAAQRALAAARPGMAARGALETGAAGAQENKITSDLAFNALQNEQQNRQAAIQGLGGASSNLGNLVGNQAGIAGLGPQAAGALFQAYPQLAQMLTQATGMPLEGANQALNFLNATQNPAYSLLRMVLPQVAQTSSSWGYGVLK